MTTQTYNKELSLSRLISYASSILGLSYLQVKKRYDDYPICLMYYMEKNTKEDLIEVRFDQEQATLSCVFDKDSTCKSSYLFLDNTESLTEYIEYLNSIYKYDYLECQWRLPGCWLTLKRTDDDVCLFLYY
jgi:hypothetical protein